MATRPDTVERILAALPPEARTRRMFGEYGLYLGDRFIGCVCDEQLFVKITRGSRPFLDESHDAPPYPGASPSLCVPEARWRDTAWLAALVTAVAADVPAKKPKGPSRKGAAS
ncbi:MAG: TfoX/Sxy family protein [Pseudomonadota bacterium]|nr:TfoX/Sxy family protein [Pseudomonadota bacterium]